MECGGTQIEHYNQILRETEVGEKTCHIDLMKVLAASLKPEEPTDAT
jgi:hypothetical protein